ncbi:MAG: signal peptidase II [Acidobacteriota bacterium]|nr:signal peptidase II [Acidobacteriota bacterium]
MSRRFRLLVILAVVAACGSCDQATKLAAERFLAPPKRLDLLGGIVKLELVHNKGAFLGLGSGIPDTFRTWLLVGLVTVLLIAALAYALRGRAISRPELLALALFVAGGCGNLVDRVWLGAVRDFVSVGFGPLRTGIFNVADFAITCGAVLMLWSFWRHRQREAAPS